MTRRSFIAQNPAVLWFLLILAVFPIAVTLLSEAYGGAFISTSFVKTLGKTLCLCLVALAMDLIWGYAGILSLGHMAFFAIGGYMVGMWLMYARTEEIVVAALAQGGLPATPEEVRQGIATQIFGVVGSSEFPWLWAFADSLWLQLLMVVLAPGLLALVFGWLFRVPSGDSGLVVAARTGTGAEASFTTFAPIFAVSILPTIIFFAALTSLLYRLGLLQMIVYGFAWLMSKTLRLSGAETLSASANIFVGQTEAPLLIKPFIIIWSFISGFCIVMETLMSSSLTAASVWVALVSSFVVMPTFQL